MLSSRLSGATAQYFCSNTRMLNHPQCQLPQVAQLRPLQLVARQLQQPSVMKVGSRGTELFSALGPDTVSGSPATDMLEGAAANAAPSQEAYQPTAAGNAPRRRRNPTGHNRQVQPLQSGVSLQNKNRKRVDYAPGTRIGENVAVLLARQFRDLMKNPIPGISVAPDENDITVWHVTLAGPQGSPYAGGMFQVELKFPDDFPGYQPSIRFRTPIWHPNISNPHGSTCVAFGEPKQRTLPPWMLHAFGPEGPRIPPPGHFNVKSVSCCLIGLQMLMSTPNPDDPLNAPAARQLQFDKANFEAQAKEWTTKYASSVPT